MKENESWRSSGPIAVLLAVLAIFGVRSFSADSTNPPQEQTRNQRDRAGRQEGYERRDTASEHQAPKRFWQPLFRFRDTNSPSDLAKEIANLPDEQANIGGWEIHYLIACVPDPIESSSGDRFDGLIDSIQRAAETQGFVYDRSYYPWLKSNDVEVMTDATLTEAKPGSGQVRLRAKSVSQKQENEGSSGEPGLLLLRSKKESSRLLLVFLVGETATAGLDKPAFASSLEFIKKLKSYRQTGVVPVLGPRFSGSQDSLQQVIQTFASKQLLELLGPFPANPLLRATQMLANREGVNQIPTFQIISGSASSIKKRELEAWWNLAKVNFQATVVPVSTVMEALYEYLNLGERHGEELCFKDNFAILCESNTAFGERVKDSPKTDGEDSKAGRQAKRNTGRVQGPTWFPFPLHISEVRSAYNKLTGPTRDNAIRLPTFGSKLPLPARSDNHPKDVEHSFAPAMTAVENERLLTQTLETISRERYRYVFIVATDIKDELFLAGLVREQCPESRLVFYDADLLFTHPDFSSVLRGSIVGSEYPLYSRNQLWSFPFTGERRLFFPDPVAQGYYNATVFLLSHYAQQPDYKALVEYGPPFPKLYRSAEQPPHRMSCPDEKSQTLGSQETRSWYVDEHRPPVWISIVGVGGLYPVAVMPARIPQNGQNVKPYNYQNYVCSTDTNVTAEAQFFIFHPGLFIVPVLGTTLLMLYVGWSYFIVLRKYARSDNGPAPGRGTQMWKLFWPHNQRWRQQLYTAICLTSVVVVYGYLVFIWLLPFFESWRSDSPVQVRWWQWITPGILLLGLLVFLLTWMYRLILWWPWQPGSVFGVLRQIFGEPPVLWVLALLLIALICYLGTNGNWPRWWWHQPVETLLFADRAMSLASGVSPIVPISCIGLAFFVWSYAHLKRLYLLENEAAINPCPREGGPSPRIALWHKEVERDVLDPKRAHFPIKRREFEERSTNIGFFLFCLIWILLFFTFSRLSIHFVPSVEGVITETLILLSLTVLSTLIVYGWLHLRKLWQSLRQLLSALTLLPLRTAYERIPAAITNQLGPYFLQLESYLFFAKSENRSLRLYEHDQHDLLVTEYPSIRDSMNKAAKIPAPIQTRLRFVRLLRSRTRPIQTQLDRALDPTTSGPNKFTSVSRACLSLLLHVHRDPDLAERLLENSPEEKAITPCPRQADPSLSIRKIYTPMKDPNAKLTIDETIRSDETVDPAIRHWLTRAEDFVALEVAVYLGRFFAQLRNLIFYLSVIPFLFLLTVSSYPFQPQRLWLYLSVVLIGLITVSVLSIILQIERDEMVSRIMKTTPNQLNFHWPFLSHLLIYAVPLLGILVAMSSDMSDLVHSWIDPLLQLMK